MKKRILSGFVALILLLSLPQLALAQESESSNAFVWPAPTSRTITSVFGKRNIALYGRERFHTGVDIHAGTGDPVLAIADGKVLVSIEDPGWGHYIMIHHGDNLISLYAHMHGRAVKRGETVTAGQQIGWVGNTGFSEAPHLHFELRENGKSVQPFKYIYK